MPHEFDVPSLEPEDFSGAKQRSVRMNNAILEEVRQQHDVFCTYVAEVRWLIMQLSRGEFADAAEVDETAVRGMETTGSIPTYSTLHRVYTHLDAVEAQYRPHDLAEGFLDVTVRERYGSSRRMHAPDSSAEQEDKSPLSVTQVYHRWAIMKSLEKVEEASGVQSGGIWQREATGVIPDFAEMSGMHKKLRLPEHELSIAGQSWMKDRSKQLLLRDVPAALSDFLTRLEVKGLPSFSAASIRSAVGCNYEQAALLQAGQMVPFDVIQTAAGKLYDGEDFLGFAEAWEMQHAEEAGLPHFGKTFIRIRDQMKVTNRQFAIAMDIRAPEDRGEKKQKKKPERSEAFRPSHLIRETLETAGNSQLAPAGVLVGLLSQAASESEEAIADPTDELRTAFTDHRSRGLKRSGASMHSNPLRLARDYWGIERDELAAALKMTPEEILAFEKSDDLLPPRILNALEKLGEGKLAPAKQRWIELMQAPEPTTVQNLLIHLQRKAGSFEALESLLSTNKHESKRGVSGAGLAAMANGTVVPPWPKLRRMCAQSGLLEFPDADAKPMKGEDLNTHEKLRRDWCVKYADALYNDGKTAVLARSLHHLYGQHAESLWDFAPNMSVSYPTQTRIMQRLEAEDTVDWMQIGRTLDAAGLSLKSAQYVFRRSLHETGSIEQALLSARNAVRSEKAFEGETYRFGLTTQERKKNGLQI